MLAWQEASDHSPELGSCASSKRVAALGGSETPSGLRPKVALGAQPPHQPLESAASNVADSDSFGRMQARRS
eukprot:scaffold66164_cov66-Phaeocystis_antarctica.AAC.2